MNYNIIDYISNLPIKDYTEKEIILFAKEKDISIFESYLILQKDINDIGTKYFINIDSLERGVISKRAKLNGNIKYFDKYIEYIVFLDKN